MCFEHAVLFCVEWNEGVYGAGAPGSHGSRQIPPRNDEDIPQDVHSENARCRERGARENDLYLWFVPTSTLIAPVLCMAISNHLEGCKWIYLILNEGSKVKS